MVLVGPEADVVASITTILASRDIVTDGGDVTRPDCPTVHATIVRRDGHLQLAIERADQPPVERTVDDPTTAATVIESWTRRDLGSPLLGVRPVPHRVATAPSRREPTEVVVVAPAPHTSTRGLQLFAAAETAYATDHTLWAGAEIGASIGLGPVCAAARLRVDTVADAPRAFGNFDRENQELLIGLDIPIALGHLRLTPGFAAGLGVMHTHVEEQGQGGETGGLRADAHITLTIPLGAQLALDVALSGDLTQATQVETSTTMQLPAEPRGIAHISVGVRYGGL